MSDWTIASRCAVPPFPGYGRRSLGIWMLALGLLGGFPGGAAAQAPSAPGPSVGVSLQAGDGPAFTLAVGLVGTAPLRPGLELRGQVLKAFQGIESCEAEFPASQRCASSPLAALGGLSLARPAGPWGLRLDAGAGVHLEEADFGGTSPLMQLGGGVERPLGSAWVGEATVSWTRAFNDTWEDRLGEPLAYLLVGVGIRRRLGRR
jgi:hypothetical protein